LEDAVQFSHDALKNDFLVINKGNGNFYRNLENKGGKELSHLAVFFGGWRTPGNKKSAKDFLDSIESIKSVHSVVSI
jgi:hypothetical protein